MYPITYNFKRIALANKVTATDSSGQVLLFAQQKLLKLKEKIMVYADVEKTQQIGELNADRVIDFSPVQTFTNMQGSSLFSVKRYGKRSIWKAHYEIIDGNAIVQFSVREDNAWIKVLDSVLREVPILAWFSGYFFNPTYNIFNQNNQIVGTIVKQPSFLESNYILNTTGGGSDPANILPIATMTVITRERMRG